MQKLETEGFAIIRQNKIENIINPKLWFLVNRLNHFPAGHASFHKAHTQGAPSCQLYLVTGGGGVPLLGLGMSFPPTHT